MTDAPADPIAAEARDARAVAGRILDLFWDNFLKSEPAFIMRDVIAIELERAKSAGRAEASAWTPIVAEVAAERGRQVSVEGWTTEHDDEHTQGEMADAAACYAATDFPYRRIVTEPHIPFHRFSWVPLWPWSYIWWKRKERRRDLIRAAALVVAEIERLDRLPPAPEGGE